MRVNAVFQGGGVKGVALVGAVTAAERFGIQFVRTAGTSVGAVVAALLAAGYNADEMRELLESTPFSTFTKKDWYHHLVLLGPIVRVLVRKGLYSADPLEMWIAKHLAAKGVYTFRDLPEGALRVVASDITQGKMLVLPDDLTQYGIDPKSFSVAKAVRMSASLPYFFEPASISCPTAKGKRLPFKGRQRYYIVDGAILSNYPLWIFDKEHHEKGSNIPTLGFQLVGKTEQQPRTIRGPVTMFSALFSTMMNAHDERYIEKHDRFRTIKIPAGMVGATDFDISEDKSRELFESGFLAGERFFGQWSYVTYLSEWDKWKQAVFPAFMQKTSAAAAADVTMKRVD